MREYEVQAMLGSGQAPPPEPAPPPPPIEEEEEPSIPGPPLLPSLRAEPEAEPEIERFPSRGGGSGLSFNGQGAIDDKKMNLLSAVEIESMLQQAQEKMRTGASEEASRLLMESAQAYEAVGRFDNAGTVYRSLGKSQAPAPQLLELWLANCERRDDRREAAAVACELGDRAIQQGNVDSAHLWFERARKLDENNQLAQRRLQRLEAMRDGIGPPQLVSSEAAAGPAMLETPLAPPPTAAPPSPVVMPPAAAPPQAMPYVAPPMPVAPPALPGPAAPPVPEPIVQRAPQAPPFVPFEAPPPRPPVAEPPAKRVELAVGRSEAVTFDLGALLSEFQRGIEAQLSGDAQGHYDLAMAYREMGLLDHAVESFRMALANPALAHRAAEMLGRCLLDQGRFDDAVGELSEALERPGLDVEGTLGLRYLLGLAHEAAGRPHEALAELERVFAQQPNYHDVAPKLRDLRKALGTE
ncbi:MAG: tetratricopeptide repeat protein [Candidatus Eisenbacteria bacterium]|uniref:Tetratricopeptide repeat protein n=1 Tax=Eiseniibacteriota bacterium TaxID=2212470 RepID=A0A538U645_UNCEI|nr:MAG: tetratricopeptide repeat protein [Candidatus Eisenbacteria bacterium]